MITALTLANSINFSSTVKLVAILSMMSLLGKSLGTGNYNLKMIKIDWLFLTYTTIPSWRGVLGIPVSNLDGNWPLQSWIMAIFHTCQMGDILPMMLLLGKPPQLWLSYSPILTLQHWFPCYFNSKLQWQKNHNSWAYRVHWLYCTMNKYKVVTQR